MNNPQRCGLTKISICGADKISESELETLRELLVYDDQSLFDFIFKDIKLGNSDHEVFIKKYLKKYEK